MPASDKQLASTVKKVTSRELPKKGADVVNMSQGTSPLPKDKGTATEPGKTVGTKRSDAPSSPGYHNVYVRRKVENDHSKKNEPPVAPGTTVQDDTHKSSNQYWNARFNRLQTYLESCDRSTQEGYMRMLRSLSAADRSMHAIDLEKRAIHLLVEEGKELQRMKALNVLGKVSPNVPSKQAPL
uniref:Serine-rich 25 kDa antigen protein n=1 Tax=Oryza glaberrima TaxID=4538 RepID=A0A0U1WYZ9_ORYGL|nr:serine-rich 25 kda antigen protein [Oryza glaberrima]